jgi:chromosome segregation ATPase
LEALNPVAAIRCYREACTNLRNAYQQAGALHEEALQELATSNKLQTERFTLLIAGLSGINDNITKIFYELKPGCECYINHATDPISLFSEGVYILTKFLSGPWREVS